MQKRPDTPDKKRCGTCARKKYNSDKRKNLVYFFFLAVASGVTTPKSFLLVVESATRPSQDDVFSNLSASSSCLFC